MTRDISRDVARGLNVLEMELCNNSRLPFFKHAAVEDNGLTYADTVFPHFAFLAGMSPIDQRRSVALVGLGLAYNATSIISQGKEYKPRFVGVLQRLGLSSLIFNSLPSRCPRYQIGLLTIWTALTVGLAADPKNPFASPAETAQTKIDRAVFKDTLYKPEYDPEGLLGAIGTAITMWVGAYYDIQQPEWPEALALGVGSAAAGLGLSKVLPQFLPVSKSFWTPSFVLVAGGYSVLKQQAIRSLTPLLPSAVQCVLSNLGRRSIEVFFFSAILHNIAAKPIENLRKWLEDKVGSTWADVALLVADNVIMAGFATVLVQNNLRLRF